jgi:hypothetical protein
VSSTVSGCNVGEGDVDGPNNCLVLGSLGGVVPGGWSSRIDLKSSYLGRGKDKRSTLGDYLLFSDGVEVFSSPFILISLEFRQRIFYVLYVYVNIVSCKYND